MNLMGPFPLLQTWRRRKGKYHFWVAAMVPALFGDLCPYNKRLLRALPKLTALALMATVVEALAVRNPPESG